jgi:hypothetical protein
MDKSGYYKCRATLSLGHDSTAAKSRDWVLILGFLAVIATYVCKGTTHGKL